MGKSVFNAGLPVTKGTTGILVLTKKESEKEPNIIVSVAVVV